MFTSRERSSLEPGAKIQIVQCRHEADVPAPDMGRLLSMVPGPGRRHTIDVRTLAS
jgi:hypothetical protein